MQICFYTNNNTLKETVQWRLCKRYKWFLTCNLKFFKWKFALLMHNLQKILFFHRSNWFHTFNLWFRALSFPLMVMLFHDSVPLRSVQKSNPSDMKQKQNKEKRGKTLRRQTIYEPVAQDFLSRFFHGNNHHLGPWLSVQIFRRLKFLPFRRDVRYSSFFYTAESSSSVSILPQVFF